MMKTSGVEGFRSAALTVALVVAGCGTGDSDDHSRSAAAGETTVAAAAEPAGATEATASAPSARPESDERWGEPLAEPGRYYGLYANPDRPDRQWFVTEAKRPKFAEQAPEIPPGHLEIGAMFGDVSPWGMKTISETEFEQAWVSDFQPEAVTIEFELDKNGRAVAFTFTNESSASEGRLVRQGDLPDDWR